MAYRNFAERTREEYLNDLEGLVGFLEKSGMSKVEKLDLARIERYLAELEVAGYTGATRKRKTASIRSFLMFLYQGRYIASNISKRLIPPFIDKIRPHYLTETEYSRLRSTCIRNARDTAIVELLLQTGIRLSELTRLKTDDIELAEENSDVRIAGSRSKKDRIIPLNKKAQEAIRAYFAERPDTECLILFLNRFGQPYGDRGVQKMIGKRMKQAGIENASVRTLRHTFGVHHIVKGADRRTIQELMGHKDSQTTSSYFSLARELVDNDL